jgi:thioredoxin 1
MPTDVNETELNNILKNSKGIVVIDFHATWCVPCKTLGPIFNELEKEFIEKITFLKADIEQCIETAKKYDLTSVPTVIIFRDSKKLGTIRGLRNKKFYQDEFAKILENK